MWFIFVIFILVISSVNNYVLMFQEFGLAPYPYGYNVFARVAHVCICICCIWYMGLIPGIITFLLYIFNFIDGCFTWITRFSKLLRHMKTGRFEQNLNIQASITIIVVALIVFTIISFFITPYASLYKLLSQNGFGIIIAIAIMGCIGFIIRHMIMKTLS